MKKETGRIAEPVPETGPPDVFTAERPVIRAACALFACAACRTKTGSRHQVWCSAGGVAEPDCENCVYWKERICRHPARRKAVGKQWGQ